MIFCGLMAISLIDHVPYTRIAMAHGDFHLLAAYWGWWMSSMLFLFSNKKPNQEVFQWIVIIEVFSLRIISIFLDSNFKELHTPTLLGNTLYKICIIEAYMI